jgi:hypothetical protein
LLQTRPSKFHKFTKTINEFLVGYLARVVGFISAAEMEGFLETVILTLFGDVSQTPSCVNFMKIFYMNF